VFLLTEDEWSRVFLESGPLLGVAYIAWRCAMALRIGWLCLRSVLLGNLLPLLLFSSCFLPLISGQLGQPTILGFVVFVSGLALAARNQQPTDATQPAQIPGPHPQPPDRRVRRRSAYAERLQGSGLGTKQGNGAAD
jgi:hypothetical protein